MISLRPATRFKLIAQVTEAAAGTPFIRRWVRKSTCSCSELEGASLEGMLVELETFWIKQRMIQPSSPFPLMKLKVGASRDRCSVVDRSRSYFRHHVEGRICLAPPQTISICQPFGSLSSRPS
jgi:hypothetical protein